MMSRPMLYNSVVKVAEDYFGPAAPRYVDRLIDHHLQKPPTALTKKDLPEIATWTSLALAMITDDKSVIEEFSQRLTSL